MNRYEIYYFLVDVGIQIFIFISILKAIEKMEQKPYKYF